MKDRSAIYYLIFFLIWFLTASIILLGPLKLLGIPTDRPLPEFPMWLGMLLFIVAMLGGVAVATFLAHRIAAKFLSKDTMMKIINKNIRSPSRLYDLLTRDIDKIYKKKNT